MRRALLLLAVLACKPKADASASLAFVREGGPARAITLAELEKEITPETVTAFDPYYAKVKTFRALKLRDVLERGFGRERLEEQEFVFRAKDGYEVPVRGALATEEGGYVAFEDAEVPGWEPIGPQRASPAPFYLVWKKPEQASLDTHPRPWQLVTIEMARFESVFPKTAPTNAPEPAQKGYALFRDHCVKCHAVNRQGGHVGPELNVPKNILEYRPEDQVRQYIKDPLFFRYGNMPAHPQLTEADLDALIAYFRAMKDRKSDQ